MKEDDRITVYQEVLDEIHQEAYKIWQKTKRMQIRSLAKSAKNIYDLVENMSSYPKYMEDEE